MCTSGCGSLTASTFSRFTRASLSGMRSVPQYTSPSRLTASTMFSGLVSSGMFFSRGSSSLIVWVTTGTVIRKMISSTSITSTSGVVLMVLLSCSSPLSSAGPTFMRHGSLQSAHAGCSATRACEAAPGRTAAGKASSSCPGGPG
jgi:hypothetical protein